MVKTNQRISFNTENRKFSVSQTSGTQEVRDFRGKKTELEAEVCNSPWKKFRGLMFRKEDTDALVFIFKKPTKTSIHSFFCKEFIAVWLDDKNKVIEIRKIKPWKLCIRPKKRFVKLIEIPFNEKYKKIINILAR
ncbi:MAG: DUF192 domain-containing protein [Candidatus Pacearchaeota archaeon]